MPRADDRPGQHTDGRRGGIYLPGADADEILDLSARMYGLTTLSKVDAHSLRCGTGDITWVRVPPDADASYAGLLTVDLPTNGEAWTGFHDCRQADHVQCPARATAASQAGHRGSRRKRREARGEAHYRGAAGTRRVPDHDPRHDQGAPSAVRSAGALGAARDRGIDLARRPLALWLRTLRMRPGSGCGRWAAIRAVSSPHRTAATCTPRTTRSPVRDPVAITIAARTG